MPFLTKHSIDMKFTPAALIAFLLFPVLSLAHGPTPQKAKESIVINASVDTVWNAIKQFGGISDWHPDVKESTGDDRHESGGRRTITLQNGGQLVEELDFYSDNDHEYSYRLKTENVQAFPTSSYSIGIQVAAGETADSSVVTLKSRFYRGDTGNTPPEKLNDEAAVKAMNEFFKNGLNGLKQKLEK
jgi:mxaD protein